MPKTDDAGSASAAIAPAPAVEHKSLDFQVKAMSDTTSGGPGSATLYAAVFGNVDRASEVILPGAFKNLEAFIKDGFFAVTHNWGELPVGTVTKATQDAHGLLLDIEFHSTEAAQACRTVMRERFERGKSVKSSIGYIVTDDSEETVNGVETRYLKGLELFEASYVPVPCNPATEAVAVKGLAGKIIKAPAEVKYYDDCSYGYYGYDDEPNHNAATAAICALLSGLMRAISRSLCDDETPKADRIAVLTKSFADTASTSVKLLEILMDDESAAESASKTFGSMVIATKAAIRPRAGVETKAGRVLSKATIAAMMDHLDAIDEQVKSMGDTHSGLGAACKKLRDYIDVNVPPPADDDATKSLSAPAVEEKGVASAPGSFAARSERLASDLDGVIATFEHQHDTRESEGRTLSPAKWDALAKIAGKAAALMAKRPDPNPDAAIEGTTAGEADPADAKAAPTDEPDWGDIYRQFADANDLIDDTLSRSR